MSKPNHGMTLTRTIKWLDKTEGRDKFCKGIQYACRYLKFHYEKKGDKEMAAKVGALFEAMRDARKLFRLFKSFKEYAKLLELFQKKDLNPNDFVLNVITRLAFMLYWAFDNLSILAKLKIVQMDAKSLSKKGATCWFVALVATLIMTIRHIVINSKKITALSNGASKSTGSGQVNQKFNQVEQLKLKNSQEFMTLVKTLGDMLPAGQGCQFYSKVFKFNVNEGWCGIGGLVSAIITSYELYD